MAQAIVYTNDNGGVSITMPTNELPIEQILAKDCPNGAIIVDDSIFPTENQYFNAWELVDGKIVVNAAKKQTIIDKVQSLINIKKSALTKLTALGLTQDEVKALVN